MHCKEVKGILSATNGMNIYRGCTHGCIYCDSRSTCYQMDHDFEDVEVKINAPELLESALKSKRKKCMIGSGSMSDPYMHIEANLLQTRKCLEIVDRYDFGITLHTKSDLILRDLDLLKKINDKTKCVVQMTLTTLNEDLCKVLEPRVCTSKRRFEVLKILQENHIPTVVWISPILPFINDSLENLEGLLNYCVEAGVYGIVCFAMGLTLRDGDREYYYQKLNQHFPGLTKKYIEKYGNSYELLSDNHSELMSLLKDTCDRHHILCEHEKVFSYLHQFEDKIAGAQISLFDL